MPSIFVPSSAKRITAQVLVIAKLNGRKDIVLRGCLIDMIFFSKKLPIQRKQLKH